MRLKNYGSDKSVQHFCFMSVLLHVTIYNINLFKSNQMVKQPFFKKYIVEWAAKLWEGKGRPELSKVEELSSKAKGPP